jgi:hypothetical protein
VSPVEQTVRVAATPSAGNVDANVERPRDPLQREEREGAAMASFYEGTRRLPDAGDGGQLVLQKPAPEPHSPHERSELLVAHAGILDLTDNPRSIRRLPGT